MKGAQGQNKRFVSEREKPQLRQDWALANCHEMKSKFRFQFKGRFDPLLLEKEVFSFLREKTGSSEFF